MTPQPASATTADTVPLELRREATIDVHAALTALLDVGWLGPTAGTRDPEIRSIATELVLPVLDGSSTSPIRKSAIIEIGLPSVIDGVLSVDVSWRSATLAALFPVFVGSLLVTGRDVALVGRYAPPFGHVGLLMDRGLLRFVAHRTASAWIARFLDRFAAVAVQDIEASRAGASSM